MLVLKIYPGATSYVLHPAPVDPGLISATPAVAYISLPGTVVVKLANLAKGSGWILILIDGAV